MADIAVAIRSRLLAYAPLVAKIVTRLYPVNRPQDSLLPAMRYVVISDADREHLKGGDRVFTARIQFDSFSKRYLESREVALLAVEALREPGTAEGIQMGRVRWEQPVDDGDDTAQGYIHRARVDLLVEYTVLA